MDIRADRPDLLRRLAWAGVVLAAAMALMWTAAVDRRPSVFYDSESYHLQGGRFAQALRLIGPAEIRRLDGYETPEQRAVNDTLLKARSPYYGMFFYFTEKWGGLWLTAFCQALAAAWVVITALRASAPRASPLAGLAAAAVTAAVSTLPFFTSFVMPDVFAGLGLLAAATLAVHLDRLSRRERAGLWLTVFAAGAFHQSNLAVLLLFALAAGLALLAGRAPPRLALRRSGLILAAALAAVLAGQGFLAFHKAATGETLRRPPFLAVRLLADGPGRDWLRRACARATPYELCRFKTLPLDDSEQMLWSEDPRQGIMNTSTRAQRIRLEDEEGRFVRDVVLHEPVGVAAAMVRNWGRQLGLSHVQEPLNDPSYIFGHNYFSRTSLPGMIPHAEDCRPGGRGCKPPFPVKPLLRLHQAAIVLAMAFIGWRLTRRDGAAALGERPQLLDTDLGRFCLMLLLVLAAVMANAAVCGALSGAFPRYQARVVWLAPLMACAAALVLGFAPAWREVRLSALPQKLLSRSGA